MLMFLMQTVFLDFLTSNEIQFTYIFFTLGNSFQKLVHFFVNSKVYLNIFNYLIYYIARTYHVVMFFFGALE